MKKFAVAIFILLIAVPVLAHKVPYRICEPCVDIDETITVTATIQIALGSTVGQPNSEYAYGFDACGGDVMTFSLCPEYGGWANYDTAISIQGPDECGAYLDCNDDYCGLQSELTWAVPGDGTYIVVVDGWSSNVGDFGMAYFGQGITAAEDNSWSVVKSLY